MDSEIKILKTVLKILESVDIQGQLLLLAFLLLAGV
jgi:hypothetical protein